ncbi:MAG: BACON domain-containing carbohydrate-binding protein [Bacteroidales bacterium]|nr:BACON domain-containing carbohydrate-binding protein [Bacteroidales bacterium]
MNKTVYNILTSFAALASAVLISSCDDFERKVVVPEIDIPDEVEVDALADRQNIVLKSTYPWFAEANESWITLHKYRGQALIKDSIVFELANNSSLDSRTGSIDIRLMDQMTKRINIVQGGLGEYITLSNSLLYFNKNKAEVVIPVKTRVDWTLSKSSENGFSFSMVDQNNLKISVERNETGADRSAEVTLTSVKDPAKTATLNVIQKDLESLLSISLPDDGKKAVVKKGGEELTFPIAVDSKYICTASDSWIHIVSAPEMEGSFVVENFDIQFTVDPNTTGEERAGWIKIADAARPECCDYFYIYQRGVSKIIYCKPGGTGDGTSWEYAMGDFAKAMAACDNLGDMEIWVAEGEYHLSAAFTKKTVNAYGGFTGNEVALAERDMTKKSTLIGGAHQLCYGWNSTGAAGVYYYLDGFILKGTNTTAGDTGNIQLWKGHGLRNCIVCDNYYGKNAGGYYDGARIVNCIFYNNSSDWSAPVHLVNSEMINSLVVNNKPKSTGAAGGIRCNGNSKIINCVIWGNSGNSSGIQMYLDNDKQGTFLNCAIMGGLVFNSGRMPASYSGILTLTADNPGFADPDARDYSLTAGSALINSGNNAEVLARNILKDIVGEERILDGTVDIGAYEYCKD